MNPYSPPEATLDTKKSSPLNPLMCVEFRNLLMDALRYQMYIQLRSPVMLTALLALVAWIAYMTLPDSDSTAANIFARVVIGLMWAMAVLAFQIAFIAIWLLAHHDKNFYRPRVLELSNEMVVDTTTASRMEVRWFAVYDVRRSSSFIYVRVTPGLAHCIPRRAFADKEAFLQFAETATALFNRGRKEREA